jgi:hypothetical protein
MTGQNAVLPENLEADVWSRDRMYGLKCSREHFFDQPFDSSYFLVIELF